MKTQSRQAAGHLEQIMTIKLYRTIDKIFGSILCAILGIFIRKKNITPDNIHTILIIKLWAVGESVLTLPMIDAIKKKYPHTKISILCRKRNAPVYESQSFINEIQHFEPNNLFKIAKLFKKYDLAIDCEPYLNLSAILGTYLAKKQLGFDHGIRAQLYNIRTHYNDQQHVVKTYLDLAKKIGIDADYKKLLPLKYAKEDMKFVDKLLAYNGITEKDIIIGICQSVAETSKHRMWPRENYAKVADALAEKYKPKIILVGGNQEYNTQEQIQQLCTYKESSINLAGKTNLKQLFTLLKRCALFISNDTGPMHIAAAQGVKTIGIFGPNLPKRFAPYGKINISLYAKQYCSPCINVHRGSFPECYNAIKGKCLKEIPPEMVLEAAQKCLKK